MSESPRGRYYKRPKFSKRNKGRKSPPNNPVSPEPVIPEPAIQNVAAPTPEAKVAPKAPESPGNSTKQNFATINPINEIQPVQKSTRWRTTVLLTAIGSFTTLGVVGTVAYDKYYSETSSSISSTNTSPTTTPDKKKAETPEIPKSVTAQTYAAPNIPEERRPDVGAIPTTPEELSALIDNLDIRIIPEDFPERGKEDNRYMSTLQLITKDDDTENPKPEWAPVKRGINGGGKNGLLVATLSHESEIGNNTVKHIDYLKHVGIKPIVFYQDGNITYHLYLCSDQDNHLARAASIVTHLDGRDDYYIAIVGITLSQCDSVKK